MHPPSDTAAAGDPDEIRDVDDVSAAAPDEVPAAETSDDEEERFARKRADEERRIDQLQADYLAQDDGLGRQRRQNVRVDVQLPITLRLAGREATSRTRDVSATGIGFSTRLPVELDQRGEVTVDFDGWRFRKSFVIRFIKPILAGSQIGVQFEELTQEEREKLVKQVFDVQRAQLQDSRR